MSEGAERHASPWHEGELELQRSVGAVDQMEAVGRKVLRSFMLEQHREFFPLLPFVVIGAVDPDGLPWATIRAGRPGFLHSPDPLRLAIEAGRDWADPAERGMEDGDRIGLVGVDLITRRRNRLNGTIQRQDDKRFEVTVGQSFGNCPRYIQNRHFEFVRDPAVKTSQQPFISNELNDQARRLIASADTFFVASYADQGDEGRQVDVSHRGGRPGFVRIDADGGLTVPDFSGNLFFNTLGNFVINPRAGLVFVDHNTGGMLQVSGRVELILDSPEIAAFEGAERLWRVFPEQVVLRPDVLPLRWTFAENGFSPNTVMTGSWTKAEQRVDAARGAKTWRRLQVDKVVVESDTIRSIHLRPVDGGALIPHKAGQHLPIRIPDEGSFLRRSYTISSAPSKKSYRLSVKQDGKGSNLLHSLRPGDEIEALAPGGRFVIDPMERHRPAVLLAAGIGITPMLSMLQEIVKEGSRTGYRRPIWLFRSSRRACERAFDQEIAELVDRGEGSVRDIRVLSAPEARDKGKYDAVGRIDIDLLKAHLPFCDFDFYLCGPPAFMQSMHDGLRGLQISDERIHAETFGPSALRRDLGNGETGKRSACAPATEVTKVVFRHSAMEAKWRPGGGTLLELAEESGLSASYSCRAGNCGECRAQVSKGRVSYLFEPSYPVEKGEALICCSVPSDGGDLQLEV
ncbi:2Fe-2S iron-sulfur cluster binding domain-containing protein (plasmid) [Rhizobium sp. WL3]|uniref:2Fe-2S iron-sulfur cluster-binding protein n=1 Tax=Rhizobium sp. WL3 TaxID=2603277 RepID=UPI0011C1DC4D|nr:pyridoxamine 5'-phosphate oxidase family protein [Rhizobium sp. WL3]QEE43224.1 2Fe-2S iron-sulfur cluster binding domain-containing protein [Rhizobium sp. WL3]